MTDRYNCLTVALERDIREDDAKALIEAITMLRGVLTVEPHITDPSTWTAEQRVRREIGEKLLTILYPKIGT